LKSAKSAKSKLTKECDTLWRKLLKLERGDRCELCGKHQSELSFPLSVFHILPKGTYPRLRYCRENTLLACWTTFQTRCCHNVWHGNGHGDWQDTRRAQIEKTICDRFHVETFEAVEDALRLIELSFDKQDVLTLRCLKQYIQDSIQEEERKK
jgi:hypothetical protein